MDFWGHKDSSFSPYHDDNGFIDFLDDDAQRFTTNAAIVFLIHLGLGLTLSLNFVVPDLQPPQEPEAVTVEIVTFDPVEPEAEPEPEPVIIEPVPAPPPPAPKPKPKPQPRPEPEPERQPPPPPPVEPEPEPEPEIEPEVVLNPPPDILAQPEPEPEEIIEPELPEPEIIPEIEVEPLPELEELEPIEEQPIVEIFDPLPEPVDDPEPIEEEPEPVEPESELEPEPLDPMPEPIEEPADEPIEDPVIDEEPPTAGVLEADPLPEEIEPEPLPPEVVVEPEVETELQPDPAPSEPEVIEPEPTEPETIPTAPTVLASPDAPETREEERRAVPQEQSDPFMDLLKRDRDSGQPDSGPRDLSGPSSGGGNEGPVGDINAPPGGGTALGRPNPGAGGWQLGPVPTGPGEAYEGLNLDMRCREEGRTHEDCPEYLRKYRGRAADGSESFNGMAGTGTDRGDRIEGSRTIPSRGSLGLPIGDNSVNSGGPSTGALDFQDTNFDREFLNKPLNLEPERGLLDDVFNPVDPVDNPPDWTLKTPEEQSEGEDTDTDWLLKDSPE